MSEAFVWPELNRPSADTSPAEGRQQAEAAGHAAGFERGLADGRAAAEAELADLRDQLTAGLEGLERQLREFRDQRLDTLSELVHAVCRNVVGGELLTSSSLIEGVLAEAMARLDADSTEAEVFLNPEDHAVVVRAYQGALPLHADPDVARFVISVRLPTQTADFQPMALIDELFDDIRDDRAG